jgi:UDP-GlcNAc:undecaprenyl-phosphate/decaprenyl-phosphate GlcNAc-1-phosphate transferase
MTSVSALAIAAVTTFVAAWPLRAIAQRLGILDRPGPRKIHAAPIPYLGGIAVLLGAAAGMLLFHFELASVLALLVVIVALGLFDDLRYASVVIKLIGEATAAVAAVALGFTWHLTDSADINAAVSVIWIVGLTNSFNLLDNMDGLASTIAAGSLLTIGLVVPSTLPFAAPLAGALIGFLLINRPPARMYLGDAGSLMIGFGVALASITAADTTHGLHSVVLLACPVALAVFDTSLVIVSRLLDGRPVQLGGTDHFSHRLRLLGWSQYQVLFGAIAAMLVGGAITFLATRYPAGSAWLAVPLGVAYAGAWLRLLRVDPYKASVNFQPEVLRA